MGGASVWRLVPHIYRCLTLGTNYRSSGPTVQREKRELAEDHSQKLKTTEYLSYKEN